MWIESADRMSTISSRILARVLAWRIVAVVPRRGTSSTMTAKIAAGEGPVISWMPAGPIVPMTSVRLPGAVLPRVPVAMAVAGA